MIKLKYVFTSALLVAAASGIQAGSKQLAVQTDKDAPAYTIQGKDSICQIFIYSPAPNQGLHLAYFTDDERWVDVGQLCASDYGPWGAEKKMYNPFVVKANDGTWRALWSVNQHAPQFAVAYSEDLITWRPQDYPIIREKGVKDVAAYQMDDGNFDIYLKTSKGKRYVQASNDFRIFKEDTLEASADEILWQRDTATIGGKLFHGCDFEVPAVHLNYIRSWFHALSEEAKLNAQPMPKTDADLAAIGRPDFVTADMVKPGAVVIDVGTTRVPDATKKSGFRLNGDVKFDEVAEKCSFITPVPGGVGPMTICSLMKNTLAAGKKEYYS